MVPTNAQSQREREIGKRKEKWGKGSIGGGGERNKMMAVAFGREKAQLE